MFYLDLDDITNNEKSQVRKCIHTYVNGNLLEAIKYYNNTNFNISTFSCRSRVSTSIHTWWFFFYCYEIPRNYHFFLNNIWLKGVSDCRLIDWLIDWLLEPCFENLEENCLSINNISGEISFHWDKISLASYGIWVVFIS